MIPPSYVGSYPTPNEEFANAYIGSLPPALADYARAYWAHLLDGTPQPPLGEITYGEALAAWQVMVKPA
jgi:hypothetical protein